MSLLLIKKSTFSLGNSIPNAYSFMLLLQNCWNRLLWKNDREPHFRNIIVFSLDIMVISNSNTLCIKHEFWLVSLINIVRMKGQKAGIQAWDNHVQKQAEEQDPIQQKVHRQQRIPYHSNPNTIGTPNSCVTSSRVELESMPRVRLWEIPAWNRQATDILWGCLCLHSVSVGNQLAIDV
jgi:hypothetical protein